MHSTHKEIHIQCHTIRHSMKGRLAYKHVSKGRAAPALCALLDGDRFVYIDIKGTQISRPHQTLVDK